MVLTVTTREGRSVFSSLTLGIIATARDVAGATRQRTAMISSLLFISRGGTLARIYSVKIFGQKYKVDYNHTEEDSYGITDSSVNRISIRHRLQEDKLVRVLMHEVTHAIIEESPLASRKRFDVEEVCDIVGFQIVDVLRDNPHLVEWIFGYKESNEVLDNPSQL